MLGFLTSIGIRIHPIAKLVAWWAGLPRVWVLLTLVAAAWAIVVGLILLAVQMARAILHLGAA
jgi:hypothetical protein